MLTTYRAERQPSPSWRWTTDRGEKPVRRRCAGGRWKTIDSFKQLPAQGSRLLAFGLSLGEVFFCQAGPGSIAHSHRAQDFIGFLPQRLGDWVITPVWLSPPGSVSLRHLSMQLLVSIESGHESFEGIRVPIEGGSKAPGALSTQSSRSDNTFRHMATS
jgi:hypothetical protein